MNEKRVPIKHDPSAQVDLSVSANRPIAGQEKLSEALIVGAQRVQYQTRGAVKYLRATLSEEGMNTVGLLADALYREAMALRNEEFGHIGRSSEEIHPDDDDLWTCTHCDNINPPAAEMCLSNCGESRDAVAEAEEVLPEVGAPPTAPGNGARSEPL